MESDSTAACCPLASTCRLTHSSGWRGDEGAAPSGEADDEKGEPSPVFLNLMKPDPTSDYGTWQGRRVLCHTARLLLVTVATFFLLILFPFSPPPADHSAGDIHRSLQVYVNFYPQGCAVSFKLCSFEDSTFNNLCSYRIY